MSDLGARNCNPLRRWTAGPRRGTTGMSTARGSHAPTPLCDRPDDFGQNPSPPGSRRWAARSSPNSAAPTSWSWSVCLRGSFVFIADLSARTGRPGYRGGFPRGLVLRRQHRIEPRGPHPQGPARTRSRDGTSWWWRISSTPATPWPGSPNTCAPAIRPSCAPFALARQTRPARGRFQGRFHRLRDSGRIRSFGYGIDYAQANRNLPYIGKVRFTDG